MFAWDIKTGKLVDLPHCRTPKGSSISGLTRSPDGRLFAVTSSDSCVRIFEPRTNGLRLLFSVLDAAGTTLVFTPDGHYAGSPGIEDDIVYVVETDQGQETLTPAEFAKKYNWKNDPSKVGLKVESSAATAPPATVTKPDQPPTPAAVDKPKPAGAKP
jgi:WD40 repeat protein